MNMLGNYIDYPGEEVALFTYARKKSGPISL